MLSVTKIHVGGDAVTSNSGANHRTESDKYCTLWRLTIIELPRLISRTTHACRVPVRRMSVRDSEDGSRIKCRFAVVSECEH